MTPTHQLFVCTSCKRPGAKHDPHAGARLFSSLEGTYGRLARLENFSILPTECLHACSNGCATALTAAGKFTYVLGRLEPGRSESALIELAVLYRRSMTGFLNGASLSTGLSANIVARIPPPGQRPDEER